MIMAEPALGAVRTVAAKASSAAGSDDRGVGRSDLVGGDGG